MSNDISLYRAAIGLNYAKYHSYASPQKITFRLSDLLQGVSYSVLLEVLTLQIMYISVILTLLFIHVQANSRIPLLHLYLLLLLCMDVHTNPGPAINTLSIFHINIRSIRNKLSYLCDIGSDYDVICVTESHLDNNVDSAELSIEGYSSPFRKDRNAHGGGVLVYVSNQLMAKRIQDIETPDIESIWLEIIFPNYSLLLCCIYRPPNSLVDFWTYFQYSVEKAITYNPQIVITGDLNVDLLTNKTHKLIDIINTFQFINCIQVPTRHGINRLSLLDPILVRECSIVESEVIDIDRSISDHDATCVEIDVKTDFKNSYKRYIWIYKDGNYVNMNSEISTIDWENYLFNNNNNLDLAVEIFNRKIIQIAENNIPKKLITIRPNDKPWYNSELRHEMRKRDRLRKKKKMDCLR